MQAAHFEYATAHPRILRRCICTTHLHHTHKTSSPQRILAYFAVASAPHICTVRTKLLRHSASSPTLLLHLHHASAPCAQNFFATVHPHILCCCICTTHLHCVLNISIATAPPLLHLHASALCTPHLHRHSSSTAASACICTVCSTSSLPQCILHHCQASNRARATPEPDPPGAEGVGHPTGAGVRALGKYGRPAPEG